MMERKTKDREHATAPTRRWWSGYVVAVAASAVAALIARTLEQAVGAMPLYIAFCPAVFAAAMVGGIGSGVLATILSAVTADLLFIEPVGKLGLTAADVTAMGLFIAFNFAISILGDRFRTKAGALRENKERFYAMANAIPQLAWMAWPDGSSFWFNQRWYEYTGTTLEQVQGWGWRSVLDPEVLPKVQEQWRRSIATGQPFDMEIPLRRGDGRFCPFLTRIMPLKDTEGRVMLWFGTATDVTEQHQAREALRQSEERFHTMANAMPQLAWIAQADGYVSWYNQRWYEYTGTTPEQMQGWGWQSVHDLEVLPKVLENVRHSVATGEPFDMEFPMRGADGRFRPFLARNMPLKDTDGRVMLWFGTATDITERKRLQDHLEKVVDERTVRLREALAELEHMSYSMVHDMRAPLRAMQSFAGMMLDECGDNLPPPALDYLNRIRDSSDRLDRLVTGALNYNKVVRENLPLTPVDLGRLLRGMVKSYPYLHPPADITIELTDLVVLGNESLLTQCFGNLLDNAVKFVPPGVKPRIRIWADLVPTPKSKAQSRGEVQRPEEVQSRERTATQHDLQPPSLPSSASVPQPSTVIIYIEDNGIGIPKDAQEKIFRMFQRMHRESEYPGTGIGLTIVKKAVERMNGRIYLDSEPGKGTRVCVELPRPAEAEDRLWHAA